MGTRVPLLRRALQRRPWISIGRSVEIGRLPRPRPAVASAAADGRPFVRFVTVAVVAIVVARTLAVIAIFVVVVMTDIVVVAIVIIIITDIIN
eukprot:711787-Pyramimonas_sp.AAC.1